jgi:hypothetical protein
MQQLDQWLLLASLIGKSAVNAFASNCFVGAARLKLGPRGEDHSHIAPVWKDVDHTAAVVI